LRLLTPASIYASNSGILLLASTLYFLPFLIAAVTASKILPMMPSYVRDGGLKAMVKMLQAEEKEKTFLAELQSLPTGIQENAQPMLIKSSLLHNDYITEFFTQNYGSLEATPKKLIDNYRKSTSFIEKLASLAKQKIR